jgi:ABC-2 type transport system permease protein
LATIYVAIGVFASVLTDNQIVSFILAMALSFVFYLGFEFIASTGISYNFERFFSWVSINEHYLSISRGVIDMRDMIYFFGMTFLFLYTTSLFLRKKKANRKKIWVKYMGVLFVVALIFIVSANFLYRIDLTADKRFTLSHISKQMVNEFEAPVEIELYLDGELEPGLRKIQNEVLEKIAVLNAFSSYPIRVRLFDPYKIGNPEKQQEYINSLVAKGVPRVSFRRKTEQGVASKFIFPGAVVRHMNKEIAVNFLKNNPYLSYENNFNHSLETSEYELISAFQKLMRTDKPVLGFLQGHKEANKYELADISRDLSTDFEVEMLSAPELINNKPDVLVIANPREKFNEIDKFIIDQFMMQGGKVLWLVDPVEVSLDSLNRGEQTFAFPRDLNLNDLLFRYGVRLNYQLLQDVNCLQIRVNTAAPGNPPRFTMHPWYYSPLLTPNDEHPVSRNLNWIKSEFVSSIDTVAAPGIRKQIILSTSPYGRSVQAPSTVSLKNINNPPARELFNQQNIPVAVVLEGVFQSAFKNRMVENYGFSSASVVPESPANKMIVIADGGMILNKVNYSTDPPQIQELGFDEVSGLTFGNKEFFINAIFYLADKQGIMHLRGQSLKMRLLDKVRLREEKPMWQLLNVLLPLLLISAFGIVYNLIRRYRYSR